MGLQPEVVFVYLDCTTSIYGGASYHLGSGYIQAYLRQKGVNTQQLIVNSLVRFTDLVDMILQQSPRAVGFTCYDSNYYLSKLIAQLLKQKRPEIAVLMGGPSATFSDRLIMQDTQAVDACIVDACIRGEGEHTMEEVVERLRQDADLTGIRGITHRQGDRVVREADRPRECGSDEAGGLDIFPSPLLTKVFPLEDIAPREIGGMGISTSRGCPYRCIYCNFAAMSGRQVRYHSVDRVVAELRVIGAMADERLAPGEKLRVEFQDDAFTLNIKRAKQLCRRISNLGLKRIELNCETRADCVDLELLELMHQAGFRQINFGLESAVPRVLRVIKKVSPTPASDNNLMVEKRFLRQIKQAVSWSQEVGIEPTVSIISGLPTETPEEGMATLEFVRKLRVKEYHHNYLHLYSGTDVFERQAEYGVSATPSVWGLPYATKCHYDTRQIPISDSKELCDVSNAILGERYFQHIQRLMVTPVRDEGFLGWNILLQQVAVISPDFLRWLNRFASPLTILSVMNDNPRMLKRKESLENMVQVDSPLFGFTRLIPGDEWTPDISEYVWQQGIFAQKPYYQSHLHRFYFVSFSKLGMLADTMKGKDYRKRIIFLLLENEQDKQELIHLSGLIARNGFSALPTKLTGFHCSFLNECCWQAEPCPASCLSRLIVNAKEEIRTCLRGGVVGKVGEELEDIRCNLLSLKQAQARERGCQQCQVSDKCSKCLFPSIPADEFCRLKREQPSITGLIKIMSYVRSAWLHKTLPPGVHRVIFGHLETKQRHKLELLTRILNMKAEPLINQTKQQVLATAH